MIDGRTLLAVTIAVTIAVTVAQLIPGHQILIGLAIYTAAYLALWAIRDHGPADHHLLPTAAPHGRSSGETPGGERPTSPGPLPSGSQPTGAQ